MKTQSVDATQFAAIRYLDLVAYLRANGWRELNAELNAGYWGRDDFEDDLVVSKRPTFRDYALCMSRAIEQLVVFEARSAIEIARDISQINTDVVRIRAVTPYAQSGVLSIGDGVQLTNAARDMLVAAACSAFTPRRAHSARKPQQVTQFVDALRLGQTERGSYVITVLAPMAPAVGGNQLTLTGTNTEPTTELPFVRRVTNCLSDGLRHLQLATQALAANPESQAFEEAIPHGVSADLCEALALILQGNAIESLGVSVRWAPSRPQKAAFDAVTFSRDELEIIANAGKSLRARAPVDRKSVV